MTSEYIILQERVCLAWYFSELYLSPSWATVLAGCVIISIERSPFATICCLLTWCWEGEVANACKVTEVIKKISVSKSDQW